MFCANSSRKKNFFLKFGCNTAAIRMWLRFWAFLPPRPNCAVNAEHRVGLVSFATGPTATKHLSGALVPAAGIISNDGVNNTPFEIELAGIPAGGLTSIGAGLQAAVQMLTSIASPNPHQAILLLSDGEENSTPMIADVTGSIGDIQVCAIGYGALFADPEHKLRTLVEERGGIFIADNNLSETAISLQKFFVDCFGQIYDAAISADPISLMLKGQVSSEPIATVVCGSDSSLSFVVGWDRAKKGCDLDLIVTTPKGNLVDLNDPVVEFGKGTSWNFAHIPLPYRGEGAGTWTAYAIRPQQVYTHGFVTDAFVNKDQGIELARNEIHRLFPAGCQNALYYEDGSRTGFSAYREALKLEVSAGTIKTLTEATSAADFNAKLAQNWELIVFARQLNPTAQVYDNALAGKICRGQKALITDFYTPFGTLNPILQCAGVIGREPVNWRVIIGDGQLVSGNIPLVNPGYQIFTYSLVVNNTPGPWRVQATTEVQSGSIIGNGTRCDDQTFFYTTLTRGFGRVDPAVIRPQVMLGQKILATFRISESNRPIGGWDRVVANVTVRRPKTDSVETYQLYDDGTRGDKLAGNNYWSREIPIPAVTTGPHILQGSFTLTKDGCNLQREAEYSIVVLPNPNVCGRLICPPRTGGIKGNAVPLTMAAVQNLCNEPRRFQVTVSDSRGWLCTRDSTGKFTPLPSAQIITPVINGGASLGLNAVLPLLICIPATATSNDSTIVTFEAPSINARCMTVVRAFESPKASIVLNLQKGWSLASLPVVPGDFSLQKLFPNATAAFGFDPQQGYIPLPQLNNFIGFWLNVPANTSATIEGVPFDRFVIERVPKGWSLLGSVFGIDGKVESNPPNAIVAKFRLTPTGYERTDVIKPGEAIWINAATQCTLRVVPHNHHLASLKKSAEAATIIRREATITATGEVVGTRINVSNVTIGSDNTAAGTTPAPPSPPEYTTQVRLFAVGDFTNAYFSDARLTRNPPQTETWVLEVDPNGNTPPSRTTTVSWNAADLIAIANGPWVLREGTDGTGAIRLADMRSTTSFAMTGTGEQYFTVTAPLITRVEGRQATLETPERFALRQNYPNPFNAGTGIRYELPKPAQVSIKIYNLTGQLVRTLVNARIEAGYHSVAWDGRNENGTPLPSGIYLYKMVADQFTEVRRMTLLK